MEKRLALKDDEIAKLQSQISDLKIAQEKEKFEADEVVYHNGIEFCRGVKTLGKWSAFCPKCHLPAQFGLRHWEGHENKAVFCSGMCGWSVFSEKTINDLIKEIEI